MNEIKCPNCGEVFTVNESQYAELLSQVRTAEFDKELHERMKQELALAEQKAMNEQQTKLAQKDQEIAQLQSQIQKFDTEKELAKKEVEQTSHEALLAKDKEVLALENQLATLRLEHENQLQKTLSDIEKERDQVKNQLLLQEKENELSLASVKQNYEAQLKAASEQVEFYKNFKAQQSTKAIGESLEQYAESEFNKVRSFAFPNAYFEKDNKVSARGSKGDFIFRECDENGVEIISIMFEMKNEADGTEKKHKNADFYKELDKDRREKNCEYAVLVTMLEADNDYFNTGIVDVSHEYEKMYVVRPQFFIQLIGLLRNAALNSLKYKQELALVREQNIDITHFEEDLDAFKLAFAKNYNSASTNFGKAIDEIDKAIKRMEEVKKFLTTSENQLRLANNKLEDVSVKKLTRKNPTMKAKFEALKGGEEAVENELLVLGTEEVDESKNINYDELEELLEQQFTMEFSNLEKLELECKEISSPDKLGDVILDEIWDRFANQIGLDMTSDTLLKQYNDKHPNGYTKEEGAKIMKDKRYTDAKNAMKEKQKSGNLKDEYTGKTLN
ncbi:hypothetical protein HMPREF9950_0663 [Streptococcus oralis SK313]|uniref:PF09903 family protein n=5 Tax=root TaxID=1 RepID=F9Q4W8_STROR|nr:hypothetical protein HMPREF9950_0663 [Streptococcus oralis SK313]